MKYNCLIVDDEPLAAKVIQSHIGKFDNLVLVGTCADAFEAINFLGNNKVDLMFLDINMPEMKGTELLKCLPHPPKVILTTAYREYAVESYELNALDYLLKPIPFERFLLAINKFFDLYTSSESDITFHPHSAEEHSFIYVREKNMVHKILTRNIEYIESLGDYITVCADGKKTTIRHTMAALETMLPEGEFLRIHRSFIINVNHLTSFTCNSISIKNRELPIGPMYKNEVFKVLNYDKFKEK